MIPEKSPRLSAGPPLPSDCESRKVPGRLEASLLTDPNFLLGIGCHRSSAAPPPCPSGTFQVFIGWMAALDVSGAARTAESIHVPGGTAHLFQCKLLEHVLGHTVPNSYDI